MNLTSIDSIWGDYHSFHISHDGEGDDLQGLAIAADVLNGKEVQVDCVVGNPDIVHSPHDKSREMEARVSVTQELFGRSVAVAGAVNNSGISEQYVTGILEQSLQGRRGLVLHTDSFKSLQALFERARPKQLSNVVILTYGSVNVGWALPKAENFQSFYQSLSESGAKLVLVEGFPFLGSRNLLIQKNTPVTYSLLEHLDGPAGKKWTAVNASATVKVRAKFAEKVIEYIVKSMEKAASDKKRELISIVSQMAKLFGREIEEQPFDRSKLLQILDQSLAGAQHDLLEEKLKQLSQLILSILEINESDLLRPFNIYAKTSLFGQALIADQIPAILFAELVEKRKNGLSKECFPAQFAGFDGKFAKYCLSSVESSLFYLDTKKKIERSSPKEEEAELVDSYLKYIDLCMATALLVNPQMVTPSTKEQLFSAPFKEHFVQLSRTVQGLGYDLPKSCQELIHIFAGDLALVVPV